MRRTSWPVTWWLVLAALLLAGCWPGIVGSGRVVTEQRTVGDWSKLAVANGMTARMVVGPASLTIRADDNLLGYVETYVDGDTLVVRHRPDVVLYTTLTEALISHPVLVGVEVSGGSHVVAEAMTMTEFGLTASGGSHATVTKVATSTMRLDASGGSHVTTSGSVTTLLLTDSGGSHVDGVGLVTRDATVGVSGGSHLDLTVSGVLKGDVSGGSHVTIYGRPQSSTVNVSGGSTLNFADN